MGNDGRIGSWTETTKLPKGLYSPVAVVSNGYIYLLGGANYSSGHNYNVYSARILEDGGLSEWSNIGEFQTGMVYSSAVAMNGYLYVVGGYQIREPEGGTNIVYRAQVGENGTLADPFRLLTNLPGRWLSNGLVSFNGNIFVLGGRKDYAQTRLVMSSRINQYMTLSDWEENTLLPEGLWSYDAAAWGDRVYVSGGGSMNVYSAQFVGLEPTHSPSPDPIGASPSPSQSPSPSPSPSPSVEPSPSPSPSPSPQTLLGDINGDGELSIDDYNILVRHFGPRMPVGGSPADLDQDGNVDIFDYNIFVENYPRNRQ